MWGQVMRVILLNNGHMGCADEVKFPVEVEGFKHAGRFLSVNRSELERVGFKGVDFDFALFDRGSQAVIAGLDVVQSRRV